MWPFLLDMTKLECRKSLRSLELEAYASLVTVFRAQGELTVKKVELLQELQIILRISIDRHKSELRRAINDEKLHTIAKRLTSGNVNSKWQMEAKRAMSVLPRHTPSTFYKTLADDLLHKTKAFLELLPQPVETGESGRVDVQVERCPSTPVLAEKDPNAGYLNEDLSLNTDRNFDIKPSELISKYLDKSSPDANNEIIHKLLENKELREKYEQQLADLKRKSEGITVKTISLANTTPITTTTISVNNPAHSNPKIILKTTLNTGSKLNQTQIKTSDALKNLVVAANSTPMTHAAATATTTPVYNTGNSSLKQLLFSHNSPKVILVPNQFSIKTEDQPQPVIHLLPTHQSHQPLTNKIVQKLVVLKQQQQPPASNPLIESKSLKIISQEANSNISLTHKPTTTLIVSSSCQKEQENDLLLNFRTDNEFYNLLPSIPPISPATTSSSSAQKSTINCFQESFKKEIEKEDENQQKSDEDENAPALKKRKRLKSDSDSNKSQRSVSTTTATTATATTTTSPPNSFETNLTFINEFMSNLNENDLAAAEASSCSDDSVANSIKRIKFPTTQSLTNDELS